MSKINTFKDYVIAGREEELEIFKDLLHSNRAELVAIYGRRRIGKTFLIRTYFSGNICFEFTGTINTEASKQLYNFSVELAKYTNRKKAPAVPANWQEAFVLLTQHIESIRHKNRKVIFFDELPWLDSMHSGFLPAFDYFWNSWCTKRSDIMVIVCGSAATWIINKIINNKGGLHNRVTKTIRLLPFTLAETEQFFKMKNISFDQHQTVQLYMVLGGVPFYLDAVQRGKSAIQNIDAICFAEKGVLRNEFDNLYPALYSNASIHISIIRALAAKRMGLQRSEIVHLAKLKTGGHLSDILWELEESGFITSYTPLDKKIKETVYRLTDEYSLFYLKFIEKSKSNTAGTWHSLSKTQSWVSWSGYAFETLCLKHIRQIKAALQIGAIHSLYSAWYSKKEAAQIDLLIDRADRCVNICEMKFSETPYEVTAKYSKELQHKVMAYKSATKTNKTIFTTIVTTFGVKQNDYSIQYVDSVVLLKDLFTK